MKGGRKKDNGQVVPPVHTASSPKRSLPDIKQCKSTLEKIDAFLVCLDDAQVEKAYKIIKRIYFYE